MLGEGVGVIVVLGEGVGVMGVWVLCWEGVSVVVGEGVGVVVVVLVEGVGEVQGGGCRW